MKGAVVKSIGQLDDVFLVIGNDRNTDSGVGGLDTISYHHVSFGSKLPRSEPRPAANKTPTEKAQLDTGM